MVKDSPLEYLHDGFVEDAQSWSNRPLTDRQVLVLGGAISVN